MNTTTCSNIDQYKLGSFVEPRSNCVVIDALEHLYDENYDTPIHTVEKDNSKIMLYELIGFSEDMLKIETEFINKIKTTYLNITGEFEDELTGWENEINIHERIDTNIYDGYHASVKNGILTVILYEIENKIPTFVNYPHLF